MMEGDLFTSAEPVAKTLREAETDCFEQRLQLDCNSMLPATNTDEGCLSTDEPERKRFQNGETDSCEQRQEQCEDLVAEQKDVLSIMPALVQDKIFGYLGTRDKVAAAQTCSSWKEAVYRPPHWRHLQAKVNLDRVSKEDMDSLKDRQVSKLKIVRCSEKRNIACSFSDFQCLKSLHVCMIDGYMLFQTKASDRFVSLRELHFHAKTSSHELALRCSLVSFPNLEILHLEGIVTSKLLQTCGEQLKSLKKLTLKSSDAAQELDLEAVSLMGNLEHLSLDTFHLENAHVLSSLRKPLKRLSVICCQLSEEHWVEVLCRMTFLEELEYLIDPRLDSGGLTQLAENLPNLKMLRFWYGVNPDLTNEDLMSISQMSSLRDVQLLQTGNVTEEGFLSLCMNLRNLTALELDGCSGMSISVMKEIAKMPSLTELTLSGCNFSKRLVEILRQSPLKLRKLHLHSCSGFETGVEDIAQMSSLSDLALSHMPLGPDGMSRLNEATFSLRTLALQDCGATVIGLMPLLKKQQLLQKLIMIEKSEPGTHLVPYLQSMLPWIEECLVKKIIEE